MTLRRPLLVSPRYVSNFHAYPKLDTDASRISSVSRSEQSLSTTSSLTSSNPSARQKPQRLVGERIIRLLQVKLIQMPRWLSKSLALRQKSSIH